MISGITHSSQYIIPLSGNVYSATPGSATATGTVAPIFDGTNYLFYDDVNKDLLKASPFPSSIWSAVNTNIGGATAAMGASDKMSYENGVWFFCDNSNSTFWYSNDLSNWTSQSFAVRSVKWIPQINAFVAVGNTVLRTAPANPGGTLTWTARTDQGDIYDIASDGTTMVVCGAAGVIRTSTSTSAASLSWTTRTSSFGTTNIYRLVYSPIAQYWMASGQSNKTAYSSNATTWTQVTTATSGNIFGLLYHMGRWIVLSNAGNTPAQGFIISSSNNPSTATWAAANAATYGDPVVSMYGESGIARSAPFIVWATNTGRVYWSR